MKKKASHKIVFIGSIVCVFLYILASNTAALAVDFKFFSHPTKHRLKIVATGYGKFPNLKMTLPQKKLLAKRAAMLDAYRKILLFLDGADKEIYHNGYARRIKGNINNVNLIDVTYDSDFTRVTISVEPFINVNYNREQIVKIAREYECEITVK